MMGRRAFLTCTLAAAMTNAVEAGAPCASPLLRRAIARAGGQDRLAAIRRLRWTGKAVIHAPDRQVRIGVSTSVRPFVAARTDSWLLSDGPGKTRSLVLEGSQGWTERGGRREPMPPPMFAHERAQYAIYGLMLLAPLCSADAKIADEVDTLIVELPGAPRTKLLFDADAVLTSAKNEVPSADDGRPIAQRFDFTGELLADGVRWPRTIRLSQDGLPYFDLQLDSFSAGT